MKLPVAGAGGFPCARPRMCRLEVWVAALNLIEAHSHTLLKQFLDASDADQSLEFKKLFDDPFRVV